MIPPIASKFVAGETQESAVNYIEELNQNDVKGILNLLGEHYHEREPADQDAESYLDLIDKIVEEDVDSCISVKPSQVGLDVDENGEEVFRENMEMIVEHASEKDVFVWIDMEDHTTTDATLETYKELASEYGDVGVCVQANLKRTEEDLKELKDYPGKIRLVKGAYDEPKDISYKKKEKVNEVYKELLEYMFKEFDGGIAVGSHDPEMISLAKELHDEYGTDFEIQMLMGVRKSAQYELAEDYEMWQYVPYGGKWMSYFYRRVRERKENLFFALRAIVSG